MSHPIALGRILVELHFACPTNWWVSCLSNEIEPLSEYWIWKQSLDQLRLHSPANNKFKCLTSEPTASSGLNSDERLKLLIGIGGCVAICNNVGQFAADECPRKVSQIQKVETSGAVCWNAGQWKAKRYKWKTYQNHKNKVITTMMIRPLDDPK